MAASPDRELGEARAALDRGDARAAVASLDRARRGYFEQRDSDGLEHVLDMAVLVDDADDRTRIARQNLVYAAKQNLRQESRRAARERHAPWADPFPDLRAPDEHTRMASTSGTTIAIAVGIVVALAALAGFVVAAAVGDGSAKTVTLRLENDTGRTVDLRGCDDPDCTTTFMHREVAPGTRVDVDLDPDTLVQLFRLDGTSADECLPLRIHDAYQRLPSGVLSARLSQATRCPGTTVLPRPGEATPI